MSTNWGGKRPRAGRKRQYVRVEKKFYTERSEQEPLTSYPVPTICIAETEVDEGDTRRGIVIDEVWYGADEAIAIAQFVQTYRSWLLSSEPDEESD
jgi:hypothetical protein